MFCKLAEVSINACYEKIMCDIRKPNTFKHHDKIYSVDIASKNTSYLQNPPLLLKLIYETTNIQMKSIIRFSEISVTFPYNPASQAFFQQSVHIIQLQCIISTTSLKM